MITLKKIKHLITRNMSLLLLLLLLIPAHVSAQSSQYTVMLKAEKFCKQYKLGSNQHLECTWGYQEYWVLRSFPVNKSDSNSQIIKRTCKQYNGSATCVAAATQASKDYEKAHSSQGSQSNNSSGSKSGSSSGSGAGSNKSTSSGSGGSASGSGGGSNPSGGSASASASGGGVKKTQNYCNNASSSDYSKCHLPQCTSSQCDLFKTYIDPAINMLSGLVGIIVVISIIAGGIQYASSEGDPQKSSRAKSRITNAILAIVAYAFLYAFLQFIIPGGLFNRTN